MVMSRVSMSIMIIGMQATVMQDNDYWNLNLSSCICLASCMQIA